MNSEIKRLLPYKLSSGIYISNVARKFFPKNQNKSDSTKSLNESTKKIIFFPKFEGKVYDPTINKTINKLKKNEKHIINELSKINSNEKFLKSKSYIDLFNNNGNNISKDLKDKIKILEKNKSVYKDKLDELINRIDTLQYKQEKEFGIIEYNNKHKLNKFLESYNNNENKTLIKNKIKKLREESDKIQYNMKKDLEKKIENKINDIDNKKREEEQKRKDLLKKMHDEEREDIEKRKKKNSEELLKIKENINKRPDDKIYLYQKNKDKYINNENNLVKLENIKRKAFMKNINLSDFSKMGKDFEQIKSKKLLESCKKMEIIKNSWAERYKLIPTYVNPLSKVVTEENKKSKLEEQNKILRAKNLKTLQKNYSKNKIPKPLQKIGGKSVDNQKEKENSGIIPYFKNSNSYSKLLRKKFLDKYRGIQEKNKSINFSSQDELSSKLSQKKNVNKVLDYLKDRRKIRDLKKESIKSFSGIQSINYSGSKYINKLIKDNGINDNILQVVKSKLDSIEEKKKQKTLLLKYGGGAANKPELSDEISDLMIDSIQAKISLIKEIDKNLNENFKNAIKPEDERTSNFNNDIKTGQSDIKEKTEENLLEEEVENSEEN